MRVIYALIFWIAVAIIAYFVVAFTGAYYVGADVPHWNITKQAIGFVREHSVDRNAANIKPPPLDDPALVKLGAERYARMCAACHVAPGSKPTPVHDDMYPQPPNLTRFAPRPAEAFWIVKHGLRMTGMPAWGETLDDHTIWALVAYLQKQPRMSADEFKALSAPASAMPVPGVAGGTPASSPSTAVPSSQIPDAASPPAATMAPASGSTTP